MVHPEKLKDNWIPVYRMGDLTKIIGWSDPDEKPPEAVCITIVYSDGSVKQAVGEHAQAVNAWWSSCEALADNHGIHFTGQPLMEIVPPCNSPH